MAVRPIPNEARPHPVPAPAESSRAHPGALTTIRFIWARRLWLPRYWMMALRYAWMRTFKRSITTDGFVFIERGVELYARKGHGRMHLGRWTYIGRGNHIRVHEGNLRVGRKCVFGKDNTINTYLDIDIGDDCIFADWIYICDFDHRFDDLDVPIRKQGIVKAPVRIGNDVWLGEKTSVLRGVTIGDGAVVASHALVNKNVPPRAVVGGVPAKVLKRRGAGRRPR